MMVHPEIARNNRHGLCFFLVVLFGLSCNIERSNGYSSKIKVGPIRHFICDGIVKGVQGVCMFSWDCVIRNGTHVGTCIDRFYFGSCCQLPSGWNVSTEPPATTLKVTQKTTVKYGLTTKEPPTTEMPDVTTEDEDLNAIGTEASPDLVINQDYREACGRVHYKEEPTGRVVNGQKSQFAKWPWQISLRQWKRTNFMHKCGAALLNENWAITAAHCVDGIRPEDLLLRLGDYNLNAIGERKGHQERRVQIVTSHPDFNVNSFEYDLALLRFYEPVTFQENIIPICLPDTDDTFVNKTGYVTGWGRLYEDGPLPEVLQEVALPIISNSKCEQEYRKAGFLERIPNIFLCAGYSDGGKDSCEGDSGGPLSVEQEAGRWQLAGIISWGIGCAEPHQPGVYTRISHFREWIDNILVF